MQSAFLHMQVMNAGGVVGIDAGSGYRLLQESQGTVFTEKPADFDFPEDMRS